MTATATHDTKRGEDARARLMALAEIPGEWASQLNGASICSYPPEDLVIEDYGRFLKKKGKGILSEERARTEPSRQSWCYSQVE